MMLVRGTNVSPGAYPPTPHTQASSTYAFASPAPVLRLYVPSIKNAELPCLLQTPLGANAGTDGVSDATLRRDDWARLIRKPLKAKGHALLDVCSPEGNIQRKASGWTTLSVAVVVRGGGLDSCLLVFRVLWDFVVVGVN